MVKFTIISLLIVFASCNASKRIERIVKRNPELMIADTLKVIDTVFIESVRYDTSTIFVENKTIEVINNERVRLMYKYDTITNEIHHDVECKSDTIIKTLKIPVETIKIAAAKSSDLKFWILLICVCLALIAFIFKR